MLRRYLLLVLLALTVAACSTSDDLVTTPIEGEVPLVTEADLDTAALLSEAEVRALDLQALDLNSVPNRATGLGAGLNLQAQPEVPLDTNSQLVYIQKKNGQTSIIWRQTRPEGRGGYRQVLVYKGARDASSVAVSGNGELHVFTAAARDGNIEVYALDLSGAYLGQEGKLVRLTDTDADESNVSMALDGSIIAWETEVEGASTIAAAIFEPRLQVITFTTDGVSLFDPSLSGDGSKVVLVVEAEAGNVILSVPLVGEEPPAALYQGDVRDPSLSYAGDLLLFAEGNTVSLGNLETGELSDLLTGTKIEHPFITADGLYFTYAQNSDVKTRLIDAEMPEDAPEDVVDVRHTNFQPYWAKSGYELRYSDSTLDGRTFVRPDNGSGLSDDDRTVKYHRYSFIAPVSDRYQVYSEQSYDGYLLLYEGFFNPRRPTLNLVAFNDDYGGGYSEDEDPPGTSRITAELEAGQRYIVVTTACGVTNCGPATGTFTNTITRNIPPPPPPFVLPEPDDSGYNITLRFATDNLTEAQQAVFEDAAARWSEIITADLANIEGFSLTEDFFFPDTGPVEGTLDDLLIDVAFSDLDGPSGLLGQAGPLLIRNGTDDDPLTIYGIMEFDIGEFGEGGAFNDPQAYEDTIVHEMGHVIGVGTLWELTGNTEGIINPGDPGFPDGPPTVPPGLPNPDYDPRFTGAGAVAEYQDLLDAAGKPSEPNVPIANDGGPGNYNGHWRELTFDNELMTPYLGGTELLSRMTAASLGDVGYTVNVDSSAVNQDYALPLAASFAQTAPNSVTYEETVDFLKFSGSQGSAEAAVEAVDLVFGTGNTSTSGCEAADFSGFTAGNIALLQRGECNFSDKVANAQAAGAVGVVMMNQGDTTDPARQGLFSGGVGSATIPTVGISYDLGVELAELADAGTLEVAIDTPVPTSVQMLSTAGSVPDFEEQLLRPIGTVSPDGRIEFFE